MPDSKFVYKFMVIVYFGLWCFTCAPSDFPDCSTDFYIVFLILKLFSVHCHCKNKKLKTFSSTNKVEISLTERVLILLFFISFSLSLPFWSFPFVGCLPLSSLHTHLPHHPLLSLVMCTRSEYTRQHAHPPTLVHTTLHEHTDTHASYCSTYCTHIHVQTHICSSMPFKI